MYAWLVGAWRTLGYVFVSAALIYLSTVLAVRWLGQRRTLTEMTVFDFTVAVALGAVIGRTATTASPSYVQGIVAVLALLLVHNAVSWLRVRAAVFGHVFGRAPVVLVEDGVIDEHALMRVHLTRDDLFAALRERGVGRLSETRLVVLESRGAFSVITSGPVEPVLVPPGCDPATDGSS